MSAHSTHCCPIHGCKYGDDLSHDGMETVEVRGGCPVSDGTEPPAYPHNNGCERCAEDRAFTGTLCRLIHEALLIEHFGRDEPHPAYQDPDSDMGRQAERIATYVMQRTPRNIDLG